MYGIRFVNRILLVREFSENRKYLGDFGFG